MDLFALSNNPQFKTEDVIPLAAKLLALAVREQNTHLGIPWNIDVDGVEEIEVDGVMLAVPSIQIVHATETADSNKVARSVGVSIFHVLFNESELTLPAYNRLDRYELKLTSLKMKVPTEVSKLFFLAMRGLLRGELGRNQERLNACLNLMAYDVQVKNREKELDRLEAEAKKAADEEKKRRAALAASLKVDQSPVQESKRERENERKGESEDPLTVLPAASGEIFTFEGKTYHRRQFRVGDKVVAYNESGECFKDCEILEIEMDACWRVCYGDNHDTIVSEKLLKPMFKAGDVVLAVSKSVGESLASAVKYSTNKIGVFRVSHVQGDPYSRVNENKDSPDNCIRTVRLKRFMPQDLVLLEECAPVQESKRERENERKGEPEDPPTVLPAASGETFTFEGKTYRRRGFRVGDKVAVYDDQRKYIGTDTLRRFIPESGWYFGHNVALPVNVPASQLCPLFMSGDVVLAVSKSIGMSFSGAVRSSPHQNNIFRVNHVLGDPYSRVNENKAFPINCIHTVEFYTFMPQDLVLLEECAPVQESQRERENERKGEPEDLVPFEGKTYRRHKLKPGDRVWLRYKPSIGTIIEAVQGSVGNGKRWRIRLADDTITTEWSKYLCPIVEKDDIFEVVSNEKFTSYLDFLGIWFTKSHGTNLLIPGRKVKKCKMPQLLPEHLGSEIFPWGEIVRLEECDPAINETPASAPVPAITTSKPTIPGIEVGQLVEDSTTGERFVVMLIVDSNQVEACSLRTSELKVLSVDDNLRVIPFVFGKSHYFDSDGELVINLNKSEWVPVGTLGAQIRTGGTYEELRAGALVRSDWGKKLTKLVFDVGVLVGWDEKHVFVQFNRENTVRMYEKDSVHLRELSVDEAQARLGTGN